MLRRISKLVCIGILGIMCSCSEKRSFLRDLPSSFDARSLERQSELFSRLEFLSSSESEIQVKSMDCKLIPFCGYLKLRNDTVYFRNSLGDKFRPFLIFGLERFQGYKIDYSSERSDSVVFYGKVYDKLSQDSIDYFRLIPRKRKNAHSTYIKYVALDKNNLRFLTFTNEQEEYTIRLNHRPELTWIRTK